MSQIIGAPSPGPLAPEAPKRQFGDRTFEIEKKGSLYDDKTYVHIREVSETVSSKGAFQVVAGPVGIHIEGSLARPLASRDDLEGFAELIGFAWDQHLKLAPKIERKLSGH